MKMFAMLACGAAMALAGCGEAGTTGGTTAGGGAASADGAMTATPAAMDAPGGRDWTTTVVQTPEGGFRMGNPNAKVKIVEFASMTCHVCRDFAAESAPALEERYVRSGQVSFEFRNFVRDELDVAAALLARCGGPAPFFKLTEQLFTEQDAMLARAQAISPADAAAMRGAPGAQSFVKLAQLVQLDKFVGMRGIPSARANSCLTDKAELDRLVAMNQAANKDYKISGTPTFLMNGTALSPPPQGMTFWKGLEAQIKTRLAT